MPSEDALAIAQNGGVTGSASEDGDMDADADDLDDDMMDKISSSPSIEDGGCPLPPPVWPKRVDSLWPRRVDSLRPMTLRCHFYTSSIDSEAKSSSTSRDSTESPSPQPMIQHASKAPVETSLRHHLLPGEYADSDNDATDPDDFDDQSLPDPESSI